MPRPARPARREAIRRPGESEPATAPPAAAGAPPPAQAARVLSLQRSVGNRAVSSVVRGRTLARQDGAAVAPAVRPTRSREVDRPITETISHAPAALSQWNGTFSWRAKWKLTLDMRAELGEVRVTVRMHSTASAAVKRAWKNAILGKWSNKFAFAVKRPTPIEISPGVVDRYEELYPIRINIQWVSRADRAHYVIRPNAAGATEGGRAGVGGTTSMTGWGTADRLDIAHEFGHMLGCPDEYFTTNGVDYTLGGTRRGFRDRRGGVMNNPAGPALARNFRLIRDEARRLRGVPANRVAVVPWR